MTASNRLLHAFEHHDASAIRRVLDGRFDLNELIDGKLPVFRLIEMYTRSPRFSECLAVLIDRGASLGDELLRSLLLDDGASLRTILDAKPSATLRRYDLECAYTSLRGATLLHICAEYNLVQCARMLIEAGAAIDEPALLQPDGTGGHTALFHCVNSNGDHCRPMMDLLIDAGADLNLKVDALVWGEGFSWETVLFDVTPISFAQCGLYPQFHRKAEAVYDNIDRLYRKKHGQPAPRRNVPNAYLA